MSKTAKTIEATSRRAFLKISTSLLGTTLYTGTQTACSQNQSGMEPRLKISLAQWSLHRALRAGEADNLDFPRIARESFGFNAVEWSNHFFYEKHNSYGYQPKGQSYLSEMKQRTSDHGIKNLLVMVDRTGNLGDPDSARRDKAVEGHHAWIEAAKFLGCHSLRVNAASDPSLSADEQKKLCIDGLGRLSEFAKPLGINIIVENHGGLSSNGAWLASVISGVAPDNCGTLPDFGNFYVARNRGNAERYAQDKAPFENDPIYEENEVGLEYDRYQGVTDLMPFAKGVSAKSHDFDEQGNEVNTDYRRMLQIVADSGYTGYVGIEYEGRNTPEMEGIRLTKALLEKTIMELQQPAKT